MESTSSARNRRIAVTLIGVAMAIFMGALENTVVGTAMPTVVASLGGLSIYSWVFAAYILASTVMTPVWGKLADMIGRRAAMNGGLALFIVGSALSGAAHSMPQLILFRVVQGLGAAALFPVGMTIVAELLTLEQRAKFIGLFSGMWGVASLVGPTVGGYLTEYTPWSWRACFYVILPFGLLSALMIGLSYREHQNGGRPAQRFDYAGTITLSGGLITLLLLIEQGAHLSTALNLLLFGASLAFFFAFRRAEFANEHPLVPPALFRNRVVAISMLHGMFAMMALIGTMSFLPLFVQAVIGTDAVEAGKILVALIIPWVLASIIGGRLILRFGYKRLVLLGTGSMVLGAGVLISITSAATRLHLATAAVFLGIGGGLSVAILTIAAQHAVAREQLGITTSTVQLARNIGAAIGAAAMGSLMNLRLGALLARAPGELTRVLEREGVAALIRPETRALLSPAAAEFLRQALAQSLRSSFLLVFAITLIAAAIAVFVPGGQAHELAHAPE